MRGLRRHAAPRLEAPWHLRQGGARVLRVAQRPHGQLRPGAEGVYRRRGRPCRPSKSGGALTPRTCSRGCSGARTCETPRRQLMAAGKSPRWPSAALPPGRFDFVWASPVCTEYSQALTTSPTGSTRGMRWCFGPSRSSPTLRRDSGPSRTRRRDCSRQGPLCSASDSSTPHTACTAHPLRSRHASGRTCAGRPAADSAGPATAARPGRTAGTHAPHKGVPGKSASATRTFAGSPVSCCTAFQRRSVTRLRRQQRINRKAGREE